MTIRSPRRAGRCFSIPAAMCSFIVLSACATAQHACRRPESKQEPAPAEAADHMAPFARMTPGEWKMTVESGTTSFRTWHWGPGRHSMRVMTDSDDAAGNPWRDLEVFYWHPGRREVRAFGVSPFARGITEGTMAFQGESAQLDFDLYQTGDRRKLRLLWAFDGPDKYHATLLEANPPESSRYAPLMEWDLFGTQPPSPPRPFAVDGATEPSESLMPLKPLLGAWEAEVDPADAGALHTRSTFEWIPLVDAIYARVLAPRDDGGPVHLLDAYLYHHTGAGVLRCLALSSRGGVHEGDLTALDGGALQIELQGYEGDQTVSRVVRLEFMEDGTVRSRVWLLEGAERTLVLDVRHKKLGENPD
jgi:hypothetical protein